MLPLEGTLAWMSDRLDFYPRFINKANISTQGKRDPDQVQPLCDAYTFLVERIIKIYEYKFRHRSLEGAYVVRDLEA